MHTPRTRRSMIAVGLASALALASLAQAQQMRISEMLINPPSTDDTKEFVELAGPPNIGLQFTYFMIIEGDGTGAGVVDHVWDLSAQGFGPEGLLLLRDAPLEIPPGPAATTSIAALPALFNPDIENGTNTYVLFEWNPSAGPLPVVGQDLDLDNDGVIDNPLLIAGVIPLDAVSYTDGGSTDRQYAAQFQGTELGFPIGSAGNPFTPDALYRGLGCGPDAPWACGRVVQLTPDPLGPFGWDPVLHSGWAALSIANPSMRTLDPGRINDRPCAPAPLPCYADCDNNGTLNIFDYICFGGAFAAQTAYADCDNNNAWNIFDYICFGQAYSAGCPPTAACDFPDIRTTVEGSQFDPPQVQLAYDTINRTLHIFGTLSFAQVYASTVADLIPLIQPRLESVSACTGAPFDPAAALASLQNIAAFAGTMTVAEIVALEPGANPAIEIEIANLQLLGLGVSPVAASPQQAFERQAAAAALLSAAAPLRIGDIYYRAGDQLPPTVETAVQGAIATQVCAAWICSNDRCCEKDFYKNPDRDECLTSNTWCNKPPPSRSWCSAASDKCP